MREVGFRLDGELFETATTMALGLTRGAVRSGTSGTLDRLHIEPEGST